MIAACMIRSMRRLDQSRQAEVYEPLTHVSEFISRETQASLFRIKFYSRARLEEQPTCKCLEAFPKHIYRLHREYSDPLWAPLLGAWEALQAYWKGITQSHFSLAACVSLWLTVGAASCKGQKSTTLEFDWKVYDVVYLARSTHAASLKCCDLQKFSRATDQTGMPHKAVECQPKRWIDGQK